MKTSRDTFNLEHIHDMRDNGRQRMPSEGEQEAGISYGVHV